MKLVTPKGQLELPQDFLLTMERTNPLLSDQGDATIPASLPATPHNLAIFGHKDRIDLANIYENKTEAILTVGPVQKRGKLVIDTISRADGIEASFAIDSSDLYVTAKDKSLKEIFNDVYEQRNTTAIWASHLFGVYGSGSMSYDYNVFPVAVSPFKTGKDVRFQFNNEIKDGGFEYEARNVRDGDNEVTVPEGYGLAPFLRLHRALDILFGQLGYQVVDNCFSGTPYNRIVLLHNCADALCNPDHKLYYRDLVPSCTLSDFLDWLLAKFHAQPVVDSEARTVRVSFMEDMIGEDADTDLTGKIEGGWKVTLQPKKRIILTPSVSVAEDEEEKEENVPGVETLTRPAAKTAQEFNEKYGDYVEVDETAFAGIGSTPPTVSACTVLRKSIGVFYAVEINPQNALQTAKRLGTNFFAYDRGNSDETESFDQQDVIPAMVIGISGKTDVCPYIGERSHYHTAIDGEKEKAEQKIMVAQFRFSSDFVFKTTGTTQKYIPNAVTGGVTLDWSLTNESMYNDFWKAYNELLLNQAPHLTARLKTTAGRLLGVDMAMPKLCDGQMLLPVSASGSVGELPLLVDAEFILSKHFANGIIDPTFPPSQTNGLVWSITSDSADIVQNTFDSHRWDIWDQCLIDHGYDPVECDPTNNAVTLVSGLVNFGTNTIQVGPPSFAGEVRVVRVPATVDLTCNIEATVILTAEEIGWNYYDSLWDTYATFTLTAVSHNLSL